MKLAMQILIHPVTISLLFCFLIISGESSAFFYIVLLIMGSLEGVLHSLLGLAGLILLILSLLVSKQYQKHLFDIAGVVCMLVSLIRFFTQPGADYNYNTFRESVPLTMLVIFVSLLLTNLLYHLLQLKKCRYSS